MDEMKICSGFTLRIIERVIEKAIEKKLGHKVDVIFNEPIEATLDDDKLKARVNVSVTVRKDELRDILATIT